MLLNDITLFPKYYYKHFDFLVIFQKLFALYVRLVGYLDNDFIKAEQLFEDCLKDDLLILPCYN